MIKFSHVFFTYDSFHYVLSDVSFYIGRNQIVSIIGNSGCGKTTLLNLIAGLFLPSRGTIKIEDNDISYLMQNITLLPYRTAFENVLLARELKSKTVSYEEKQKARDMLDIFNIEHEALHKFPGELSGGMKQRIGLAQTMLTDASFFLLDEPFNAIDINTVNNIEGYMWEYMKREKKTMFFITHNIDQALQLSDRIFILKSQSGIHEIIPPADYCLLPPDKRIDTQEYKKLFFDIVGEMKYEK